MNTSPSTNMVTMLMQSQPLDASSTEGDHYINDELDASSAEDDHDINDESIGDIVPDLDLNAVLKGLALQNDVEDIEEDRSTVSMTDTSVPLATPENPSPVALACLVDSLLFSNKASSQQIVDFEQAQSERNNTRREGCLGRERAPYTTWSMCTHLSDIRSDLRWAEDTAIRRQEGKATLSWAEYEEQRLKARYWPYFSILLTITMIAMFVVSVYVNGDGYTPSEDTLLKLGAYNTGVVVEEKAWYRLVTPAFLHLNITHLILNIFALGAYVRIIEKNHGTIKCAGLFFFSAVGGTITSGLVQPQNLLVGASGGILGLMGACIAEVVMNWKLLFLVFRYRNEGRLRQHVACVIVLAIELIFLFLSGLLSFMDNFTHLGGLVYGFLAALTVLETLPLSFFGESNGKLRRAIGKGIRVSGLAIAIALMVFSCVALTRSDGTTSICQKCRVFSCPPFFKKCDWCAYPPAEFFYVVTEGDMGDTTTNYSEIEMLCPSGEEILFDIRLEGLTNHDDVVDRSYEVCREVCDTGS